MKSIAEIIKKSLKRESQRVIHVKAVAHEGAADNVFIEAREYLKKYIPEHLFVFSDKHPDVIFFVTGGSEQYAVEACTKLTKVILWSYENKNSHASAMEVMARLIAEGKKVFHWDIDNANFSTTVQYFFDVLNGINHLKDQQLGLLGHTSDWLVASDVSSDTLKDRFGIDLVPVSWDALPSYKDFSTSKLFDKQFKTEQNAALSEASKVHNLIQHTIEENHLDAITVECFPQVKEHKVTACLSLSLLNNIGIPAGCEGDLTAITGMMFAKAILNQIPWMANTIKISENTARFAHCTISVSMVDTYDILTHYETNVGTAIQGNVKADLLTVFRFDNELSRIFIAVARVINRPKNSNACRTQIEVEIAETDLFKLKHNPLGNHHLFLEGNYVSKLKLAAEWLSIEIV